MCRACQKWPAMPGCWCLPTLSKLSPGQWRGYCRRPNCGPPWASGASSERGALAGVAALRRLSMSTDVSFRTATERQSWAHYYGRPLSWHDHLWNVAHHLPLMYRIWRLRPRSALEVASGTGSLGIFVSHSCPRVVSFDINPELVERCRENN